MLKIVILFSTAFLLFVGCRHVDRDSNIYKKCSTDIVFGRLRDSNNYEAEQDDCVFLMDSSLYSEKSDSHVLLIRNSLIISHDDYLKHQQNLDSIVKISGEKSDSLSIFIDICINGKILPISLLNNNLQISEYVKMLRSLLGKYGHVPIPKRYRGIIK